MLKKMFYLFFFFTPTVVYCLEEKDTLQQPFPLSISILDESLSLPNLWFLQYSFNPSVIIGTEYLLKSKKRSDWHLTGNLGFYYHEYWQSAVFVNSELGYRYHLGRLNASLRLGIGYAHTFSTKPVYSLTNGNFEENVDYGNPTFMPSLALRIGYRLKKEANSLGLFLTFMETGEIPFTTFSGAHQFVGIGIQFYPFHVQKNK